MQERNFEKQVREKMEELSLVPSESVWQKVEKQIRKKKERRRVVLWLFTFLLLPAGFLVWQINESKHKKDIAFNHRPASPSSVTKDNQTEINEPSAIINKPSTGINELPTGITEQPANTKNQPSGTKQQPAGIEKQPEEIREQQPEISGQPSEIAKQQKEIIAPSTGITRQPAAIKERQTKSNGVAISEPTQGRKTGKSNTEKTAGQNKNPLIKKQNRKQPVWANANNRPAKRFPLPSGNHIAVKKMKAVPGHELSDSKTGAEDVTNAAPAPAGSLRARLGPLELLQAEKRTVSEEVTDGRQRIIDPIPALALNKGKKWKWSVQVSTGISGIHKDAPKPHEQDVMFPTSQIVSGSASAPPPSRIENNFSVSAGFRLARKLNKRLSVTAALQYHFYSTRIRVGHTVYNDTLLYSSSGPFRLGNYYLNNQPANDYHNRYHFVELPLGVEYKLLSKKPLYGHAGVNIAQLTSTNALFYHDQAGIYFTGKSLFRKTQASAFGELTYRIVKLGKTSIVTGPQGQYAITGLMNKNVNGKQHLFFAGWNTRVFF